MTQLFGGRLGEVGALIWSGFGDWKHVAEAFLCVNSPGFVCSLTVVEKSSRVLGIQSVRDLAL